MKTTTLLLLIQLSIAACHNGRQITTVTESTDNSFKKIEFSGHIIFNTENTAIKSMSAGSYLKFEKNDTKLLAEPDETGRITYEINDHNVDKLDDSNSKFVSEAIEEVVKITSASKAYKAGF